MALSGKIAVVTGAAQGIGKEITEQLLQNGAKVVLLDVNETAGKSLKKAFDNQFGRDRCVFRQCNVESEEQIKHSFQRTVATFGGIDIVCNNAGISDEGKWERTVSINLVGVIRVTYVALEHMNRLTGGRGGVVVNIASMAGINLLSSCPAYTATKHGVVGFTRAIAAASTASGYGICFNMICPGAVQTNLFSTVFDTLGQFSHLADVIKKSTAKGVLDVSDVAECILELVTDVTKNGEALMVNPNGKKYMTFPTFT
ncbi:15-hydroxyprostaglandin dehydrogenase [NAD(+)]-like [Leuresthes tenuis]|uniref:15-hydroxyprostaglandin dehydrogenase [NAD(+)]-like n=1 Tax=Leuresthes tenuis TaxID=355514 RepID=UPI003B50B894